MGKASRWNLAPLFRAIEKDVLWGNFDRNLTDMEQSLRLALEATRHDFWAWENGDFEERFGDEFCVPAGVVAALCPEERLAYVARLLVTLAHAYGVSAGVYGTGPAVGEADDCSPAALMRGLNDLSWMGCA